jgi:hypothetical protein
LATHNSHSIKFTDYTTVVGLITNGDETAHREVSDLTAWCQDNNFYLNVSRTKELIVDYRKQSGVHIPIHIGGATVERARASSSSVSTLLRT